MELNLSNLGQTASKKESWKYDKIYDFFAKKENKSDKTLNFGDKFDYFHTIFSNIEKSEFIGQKSTFEEKKEVRYFLRKVFNNLEQSFNKASKEEKLQLIVIIKAFVAIFGSTQKIGTKLQKEL